MPALQQQRVAEVVQRLHRGRVHGQRALVEALGQVVAAELVVGGREAVHRFDGSRRSEEHTSELQSLMRISYAVFCLKKKKNTNNSTQATNTQMLNNAIK